MQNLLTSEQIRKADAYTIVNKPVRSIDLMEAAAHAFTAEFIKEYPDRSAGITVYCGTGDNGGDGLAIARLLREQGYAVSVLIAFFNNKCSAGFDENLKRLEHAGIVYATIDLDNLPDEQADVLIDALLGSGLNKPLQENWLQLVNHVNALQKAVVSVDVPTGFVSEGPIGKEIKAIKAALVISFQRPKINFFLPESAAFVNRFKVIDIGLDEHFIQTIEPDFAVLEKSDICALLKQRRPFSHKGTYGHALIVAGAKETMGAALLCTGASVYTGSGLTTACIPAEGLVALNCRIPEAMVLIREDQQVIDYSRYSAIAAGPGIGTGNGAASFIAGLIVNSKVPLVLDADAFTVLAGQPDLTNMPAGTILTPHMKEFDRLFGAHTTWWERLEAAKKQADLLKIIIVLKNRYTFILRPGKPVLINPTGGPNMATGGMGDVLTGMIVSFLAQGYSQEDSAILATYIHGFCGETDEGYVTPALRLVEKIPEAIANFFGTNPG